MYKDMLPYTNSKYFNMNFDEPFELGKGLTEEKAKEIGIGNLYIDYALKAYEECKKYTIEKLTGISRENKDAN